MIEGTAETVRPDSAFHRCRSDNRRQNGSRAAARIQCSCRKNGSATWRFRRTCVIPPDPSCSSRIGRRFLDKLTGKHEEPNSRQFLDRGLSRLEKSAGHRGGKIVSRRQANITSMVLRSDGLGRPVSKRAPQAGRLNTERGRSALFA